jgi:hypothetical protein
MTSGKVVGKPRFVECPVVGTPETEGTWTVGILKERGRLVSTLELLPNKLEDPLNSLDRSEPIKYVADAEGATTGCEVNNEAAVMLSLEELGTPVARSLTV